MRELVRMLRKETLELLVQIGEERYPHGRLCLKWIDYDRLHDCEADFFDYVLCLKNGTHVPGLYEKVVNCFQKALRVCPSSTIKLLIKITAGAIEGKGGEEEDHTVKWMKLIGGPGEKWETAELGSEDRWKQVGGRPGGKWDTNEQGPEDRWKQVGGKPGGKWDKNEQGPEDRWKQVGGRPGGKWDTNEQGPDDRWKEVGGRPGGKWDTNEQGPEDRWKQVGGRPGGKWDTNEQGPEDRWKQVGGRPGGKWDTNEQGPDDRWKEVGGRPGGKWDTNEQGPEDGRKKVGGRPGDKWETDEEGPDDRWKNVGGRPGDKWETDEEGPDDRWKNVGGRPGDKWPGGSIPNIIVGGKVVPGHRPPFSYEVEELPPLPKKWPITPSSRCGRQVIEFWIRDTEQCFRESKRIEGGIGSIKSPQQNSIEVYNDDDSQQQLSKGGFVEQFPEGQNRVGEQPPEGSGFERVIGPLFQCFREKRPYQCRFHKASVYFEVSNKIPDIIKTALPPDVPEKTRICIDELKSPKTKQCIAQLFMYYVSLHHAHYTKDAREKILSKARLCLKVNLPHCPQNYIDNFLRFFLAINNVGLPDIDESRIITRVTIPEGYIWCETRIISEELPVPPTTKFNIPPKPREEKMTITPTTIQQVKITPPPTFRKFSRPPHTTRVISIAPPPKTFVKLKTPTTVFQKKVTPPTRWQTEVRPPKPTRKEFFTPPPQVFSERKTPTTVRFRTLTPPTYVPRKTFRPPKTVFFTMTPRYPVFTEVRTPTTIIQQSLVPKTEGFWKTKIVPTRQTRYPPQPKTFSQRYPFTTEVVTRPPKRPKWTLTQRPAKPYVVTYKPPPKVWTKTVVPTTTRVTRIPVPPKVYTEEVGTTTVKVHFSEEVPGNCYSPPDSGPCLADIERWYYKPETESCETFQWGGCKPNGNNFKTKEECEETCARKTVTTGVYRWTPPGKTEGKRILPTTFEIEIRTPTVKVPTEFIPRPRTTEIYYPPPPKVEEKKIIPTTIREIEFTPPQLWKTKVRPPRPTYVQTFTPKPPTDCYSPKEYGPCEEKFPRWYWNKALAICQRFIWGGCKPNGNNFETKEECEDTCGRRTVITKVYKWTPEVPRWEMKKTETTVNIYIKEKSPSITVEVVRSSPGTRIVSFRPPARTYTQPFRPSTVKYYTMTVTGTERHVRPTPPTVREVFPPASRIFTFKKQPTTSREFTQRITPGIWRKTRTPPEVRVFTVTPEERVVTQNIPPTHIQTFEIPYTIKEFEVTRPPVPPKVKTFPPMPRTYKDVFKPTTVRQFSIPPKPKTYSMEQQSTTIQVELSEIPEKPFTAVRPPKVTCIVTIPPSDCFSKKKPGPCKDRITRWFYNKVSNQCEKFIYGGCEGNANNFRTKEECVQTCMRIIKTRPPVRQTEFVPPPTKSVKTGPPITTRQEVWPPHERKFSKRITPPTIRTIKQTVPPRTTRFSRPPIPPRTMTIIIPSKIVYLRRIPTTSRIVKYTAPQKKYTQQVQSTTVNVGVTEEEVYTRTGEYVPPTEEFVFPADTKTERQEKLPTTIRVYTEVPQPMTIKKIRTPAPTVYEKFTPQGVTFRKKITPTTSVTFELPFSVTQKVYRPPIRPKVITATPPERTRKGRITPSTTEIWTAPPKPRTSMKYTQPRPQTIHLVKTPPAVEWQTRIVVTPEIQTYPGSPPEYTCVYPTPPSTTVCEWIPRKCLPGEEVVWRDKILNCTLSQTKKKGMTMYKLIIMDRNLVELRKIVEYCVKCIGDTICRNTTFPLAEWMLDKVDTYVGEYGEKADHIDIINDDVYHEMKQCVIMADESQVERCYPGLYLAMTDLIVYEKPTRMIKYRKTQDECLQEVFRHCSRFPKFKIEEKLENVFEFCIKITAPSEKSACKGRGPPGISTRVEQRKCTGQDTATIAIQMIACVEKELRYHNGKITVQRALEVSVKCLGFMHCEVDNIEGVMKFLSLLVKSLVSHLNYEGKPRGKVHFKKLQMTSTITNETDSLCHETCLTTGGNCRENVGVCVCPGSIEFSQEVGCIPNKCARSLGSIEIRQCFKSVEGALRELDELEDRDLLIKQITRCLTNALRGCNSGTIHMYVKYFVKLICSSCNVPEIPQVGKVGYEITRVGVTPSGIDVCGNVFRTDQPPARLHVEDDCVTIEGGVKGGSMQVRVSACREEEVDQRLKTLKECMENKVTNIGLRNPDYLTLEKVIQILKDCEDCEERPVTCRTKYREDFKKVMKALLHLVTTNVLAETDEQRSIRNALNYDKMGVKCKSILYKYLSFDTTEEQLKRSKAKAIECLQNCLKGVGSDVLDDLLDAFEIGMVLDENKIVKMFQGGKFKKCDSDEQVQKRVHFYNAPSYMNCGPGGVLVRKERDLESQLYETSAFIQNTGTEKIPFLKPVVKRASSTECTAEDFTRYFEQLLKCGQKKLHLKFRRKRNKCKLNDLKHAWTALVDCMIENIGDELTCQVTTEEQMTQFLQYVSQTLHTSLQSIDDSCPVQQICYGTEAPALSTCSKVYLQLLKAKETNVPMRDILDGSFSVLECLNPIWPNCPREVQFTALHFLYLPLGLNYDSSINQGLKFVSCDEKTSPENSSYSRCMGKGGVNEIEAEQFDSSIEICMSCVKKKEGICKSSNDKDLINRLGAEFTRINRCLKRIISDDNCLKDMTTRIQDKCMSDFYRLYKNTTKGIVLNSIEYFRKFNSCLTAFKSECSEDYKRLTLHLYYDILGLSSVFKPRFQLENDSTR